MQLHDVSQLPVMEGDNCVGAVSESALSVRGLEDVKVLEMPMSDVMESPFPMVESTHPAEAVVKLLSKANPAVLVRENGGILGIVTRSDMLQHVMAR